MVEPGAGWTRDPFGAEIEDGRIYGRGACDMKGGLAASIVAAEALIDTVPDLPGAIEISGTVDEESGGYAGVAWLAERGYFSQPRVDHVLIPEPLYKNCVCLGHRGVWWGEIEMRGPHRARVDAVPGHVGDPRHGRLSGAGGKRAVSGPEPAPHPRCR